MTRKYTYIRNGGFWLALASGDFASSSSSCCCCCRCCFAAGGG